MLGYSPKLPLVYDNEDGPYLLTKSVNELAKQNLKMLILTKPGERIMMPDFGVGLNRFLFENDTNILRETIISEIKRKVNRYLPYINIIDLDLNRGSDVSDNNTLYIKIKYSISNIPNIDELNITV